MVENNEKYTILHQIEDGDNTAMVFVFRWNIDFSTSKNKVSNQREIVRFFLKNELEIMNKINHSDSGAPFLVDSNQFISISHSGNLFAIHLSKQGCVGVDVQLMKKNLYRGRGYFINDFEEKNFSLTERELLLIWCAKETVYKTQKGEIQFYKENITITEMFEGVIKVNVKGDGELSCRYLYSDEFALTYVTK